MDQYEAHKAFDSLWSVTDEIFKYVADIRTILEDAKFPDVVILPSDPPSYEHSTPEQLIENLKQKVTGLENLNEKRKVILEEFNSALKSDDLDEKKQIREEPSEGASADLRNNALKSLGSYTRKRHAALKTNLELLEQASQKVSEFRNELLETNTVEGDPIRGCSPYAEWVFNDAMNITGKFNSQLSDDRVTLLREGKMVEEAILKVPHETNEEISKITKNVRDSYLQIKNTNLCTFRDQISPVLDEYLEVQTRFAVRNTINSVVINLQHTFNEYTKNVQAYNQALQSLADHLVL